jgi:hypothetical protein
MLSSVTLFAFSTLVHNHVTKAEVPLSPEQIAFTHQRANDLEREKMKITPQTQSFR